MLHIELMALGTLVHHLVDYVPVGNVATTKRLFHAILNFTYFLSFLCTSIQGKFTWWKWFTVKLTLLIIADTRSSPYRSWGNCPILLSSPCHFCWCLLKTLIISFDFLLLFHLYPSRIVRALGPEKGVTANLDSWQIAFVSLLYI